MNDQYTFLCICSYFKGEDFLIGCKEAGNRVYLITSHKLKDENWPWDHIDDVFFMEEEEDGTWNMDHLIQAVAYQMREIRFDRFVALDDFDVEKVSRLREQFRIPGMGDTTSRYFRDKLAMRVKARLESIPVPAFTALFNNDQINQYADTISPPWMIKPRSEASAVGIKKIDNKETLWRILDDLGDDRHKYLLEKFSPGQVFHADALTYEGKVVFSRVSGYLDTPFEVAHGGGIFRSQTLAPSDPDNKALIALNKKVLTAFGMQYSASHTEFIKSNETGEYFFLETSSRVGGAHLAEMVEAASGVNLWREWANLENAVAKNQMYTAPKDKKKHAGIVVSLSRFEHPDMSVFNDPEVVWKINKPWHVGMIVLSNSHKTVRTKLDEYTTRIGRDFHASAPAPARSL
ncbi:ATPase [Cryomorphaceae bacterium 1068]|nr:ATPase [Cryomorphaceae bacterium 1068]